MLDELVGNGEDNRVGRRLDGEGGARGEREEDTRGEDEEKRSGGENVGPHGLFYAAKNSIRHAPSDRVPPGQDFR